MTFLPQTLDVGRENLPGPFYRELMIDQCLSSVLWKGAKEAQAGRPSAGARPQPAVLLPMAPRSANADAAHAGTATDPSSAAGPSSAGVPSAIGPLISERERLIEAMERSGWVQAKAARMLGLTSRQVGYALKKHGIEIKHF